MLLTISYSESVYHEASAPVTEAEFCIDLNRYVNDIGLWEKIDKPFRLLDRKWQLQLP